MKRILLILAALAAQLSAQQTVRWAATTGDVVLSGAATAATVQQVATTSGANAAMVDQIVIYCSVSCNATLAVNGAAATTTAGTLTPIAPLPANAVIPLTFWTASNVGAGTAQGGIVHIPAGATITLCLSPSCGAAGQVVLGAGGGTGANLTVSIASITGTANITVYGRSII